MHQNLRLKKSDGANKRRPEMDLWISIKNVLKCIISSRGQNMCHAAL